MRRFHGAILLSVCLACLLGAMTPVRAEEGPLGRTYTVGPNHKIPGVLFRYEASFETFLDRCGEQELFWSDWDSDVFAVEWSREAFEAAVESDCSEFEMEGAYALHPDSSRELRELWDAGLVTMPDPPVTTVRVRPKGLVTAYRQDENDLPSVEVHQSTPFEEAVRFWDAVCLVWAEESPYDGMTAYFRVSWDEEAYRGGLESGAASFEITGTYLGAESEDKAPWIRAEGTPRLVVRVRQPPPADQPEVYENPLWAHMGASKFTTSVTPNAPLETLVLPAAEELSLRGPDGRRRAFALSWSEEEYAAGLASGADAFTVSGRYAAGAAWPREEQEWWARGLIRIAEDAPLPQLTVRVVRETEYPFTADIVYAGDLAPVFRFPWLNGVEAVTCAFSLDNETWYEETLEWEGQWYAEEEEWIFKVYDGDYELLPIPPDGAVYVKLTVSGSALAGETGTYVLKPPADGGSWDMTPYDDQGGDHGGGGQGEHDRPGMEGGGQGSGPGPGPDDPGPPPEEPEVPPEAEPEPEPEPAFPPVEEAASPIQLPASQEAEPGQAGEQPPAPQAPPAGTAPIQALQPQAAQSPPGDGEPEEEPVPSPPDPASAPSPAVPQADPATPAENDAPQGRIPGFAAATAATSALVLGGAAWFHWRGKRK